MFRIDLSTMDFYDGFWLIMQNGNRHFTVYFYRIGNDGKPIKPYLMKCGAYLDVLDDLRNQFGDGKYRVLIRFKRKMVLSGQVNL